MRFPPGFNHLRYFKICSSLLFALFLGACATTEHSDVLDKYVYSPSDNRMQQIDETILIAKAEGKMAMIVLGAQWCHDSVGLAKNFSSSQMQTILNEKYETVFIDVGFLEDRRDITQRFGYPSYFGTPTVMIIEPNTETLLNYDSISKWQSADSVPMEEYQQYFQSSFPLQRNPQNAKQNTEFSKQVAQFEHQQIERLYHAYSELGPMLQADELGELDSKEQFYKTWKDVRSFRVQLQSDLVSLRNQVHQKQQSKDKSRLVLPTYPAFSWETM